MSFDFKEYRKKQSDKDYDMLKKFDYDLFKDCVNISNAICFNHKLDLDVGYEIERHMILTAVRMLNKLSTGA